MQCTRDEKRPLTRDVRIDDLALLVYGGRADIQWSSRADSPYPHLWSLPMRTLDPELEDLGAVLTGKTYPAGWIIGGLPAKPLRALPATDQADTTAPA